MVIDGKALATKMRENLKTEVEQVKDLIGRSPCLVVILVGDDYASSIYVGNKAKACENAGITSHVYKLPGDSSQEEVLKLIDKMNHDKTVDGLMVQLPLPKQISEATVLEAIDSHKDVDGLHIMSSGRLLQGKPTFLPCTPHGVIKLLESIDYEIEGKHAVVIGRSNIVGKPLSLLLLEKNATVTMCHSRTEDLKKFTKDADILVSAIGRANFVTADMVKEGAAVIDVGINRLNDKVTGDVDFEHVEKVAGYITPVPGGVGPMTITMLLYNTVLGARVYAKK